MSKFQVKFTAGGVTAQTKVVNLKQKTLNPVFNEEIDMQIDINAKFSIGIFFPCVEYFDFVEIINCVDLSSKKGTISANLDTGVQCLKLSQGFL